MLTHPQPPWITGQAGSWSNYFGNSAATREIPSGQLDPIAYLGATAALFISTESTQDAMLPTAPELGPFHDLHPYISRRHNHPAQELPRLPVTDTFQQTFSDWANNKINLTETPPQP